MNPVAFRASLVNILGNTFLFVIKIWAGMISGSIALLSEAFSSLTDIVSSIAVFICVRISNREADEGHPFGHTRAEPIAGLLVAILAGILGFEIIRESFERLFLGRDSVVVGTFALLVPVITILLKSIMTIYFRKVGRKAHSPAIMASAVDSMCDLLVALAALAGLVGVRAGYPVFDPIAGLIISLWIIYTGYRIGMENIDCLMGKAPEPALMDEIKEAALGVEGVKAINTVRAHYVGNFIHVEIHVEVDKDLSTFESHDIGKEVEEKIENIKAIEKAFIHIDPV